MKSLIALPLVLAGSSAKAEIRRRMQNLDTIRPESLPKYDLNRGATCVEGYEPLTSSWQDCAAAARSLGFDGEDVAYVKYNKPWGTTRPQGCFRKGNGEFHFNDGAGGDFKSKDRILCVLNGQGPSNRRASAGSSLESDIAIDTAFEEAGPEGAAPIPHLDPALQRGGYNVGESWFYDVPESVSFQPGPPPANDTNTDFGKDALKFYSPEEGWTKEAPVERMVCGSDQRERIHGTTSKPWKWIVSMEMTLKDGRKAICSGFFISKRAIMTAAHCIYAKNWGGFVRRVKVCPGRNDNSFPYGCQYVENMWTTTNWVHGERPPHDYAMLTLPDNSMYDKGIGYFGFTSSLWNVWGVNVAGYPSDKDSGRTLWWNYSSYSNRGAMLKYDADIYKGMSGGPVWAYFGNGERRVVGVNAYGGCPNWAVRVTSGVFGWMNGFRKQYN